MTEMPAPAPVKGGLWPYFMMQDAMAAAEFYGKAFGAEIVGMWPPGDERPKVNVHLYINGHSLMLNDPMDQHGFPYKGHAGCTPQLYVEDVDSAYERAVAAGCESGQTPQHAFWADRYAMVRDAFGLSWGIAGPKKG